MRYTVYLSMNYGTSFEVGISSFCRLSNWERTLEWWQKLDTCGMGKWTAYRTGARWTPTPLWRSQGPLFTKGFLNISSPTTKSSIFWMGRWRDLRRPPIFERVLLRWEVARPLWSWRNRHGIVRQAATGRWLPQGRLREFSIQHAHLVSTFGRRFIQLNFLAIRYAYIYTAWLCYTLLNEHAYLTVPISKDVEYGALPAENEGRGSWAV